VLHYACCGFDAFWTKYATLGRFADRWWGEHDIASAIGWFHLDARDVVMSGNREDARNFYRERCVLADPEHRSLDPRRPPGALRTAAGNYRTGRDFGLTVPWGLPPTPWRFQDCPVLRSTGSGYS